MAKSKPTAGKKPLKADMANQNDVSAHRTELRAARDRIVSGIKATSPKKTGRPTKMTQDVVGKLVEAFMDDFTVEEACRFAGIHKDTFYMEIKRNQAFADAMERAQDYPLTLAKKRLFRGINAWDGAPLALKYLERRQRDRYSPKTIQEIHGAVPVTYDDLQRHQEKPAASSPEEARKLAEGGK